MTSAALTAILVSAALHAAWNGLLKSCRDPEAAGVLLVLGAAALSLLAGLVAGDLTVPAAAWPLVVTTGVIEGVYFVTLGRALRLLPLGSAYGISRGVGLLVLWPASVLWFGEAVDVASASGAVLLSLGLLVLIAGVPSRVGLLYALGCALSISAYPLAYKRALLAGVAPFALFGLSLTVALPLQVAGLGRTRQQRLASAWQLHRGPILGGALLCASSFLLFLFALRMTGAGRITALRNLSVLFAALWAWRAGEPLTGRGMASALAIACGAALLVG